MRTAQEVREEIVKVEAHSQDTWDMYKELLVVASQLLGSYRADAERLSELYAEEHYRLTKERGNR